MDPSMNAGGGIAEVPQQYEEVKSDKAQPAAKKQRSKSGGKKKKYLKRKSRRKRKTKTKRKRKRRTKRFKKYLQKGGDDLDDLDNFDNKLNEIIKDLLKKRKPLEKLEELRELLKNEKVERHFIKKLEKSLKEVIQFRINSSKDAGRKQGLSMLKSLPPLLTGDAQQVGGGDEEQEVAEVDGGHDEAALEVGEGFGERLWALAMTERNTIAPALMALAIGHWTLGARPMVIFYGGLIGIGFMADLLGFWEPEVALRGRMAGGERAVRGA